MTDSTGVVPLQVQFTNTSTTPTGVTITNYSWHFGDPSSTTTSVESPIFTYYFGDSQDTIRLIITDSNGCTDTAYKYVDLKEPLDSIFIPNVFSPNDDQKNDVFFVKSFLIKELNVVIFNRWGQLIYEWEGVNTGWDGRTTSGQLAPEGTYYYMIKGELKDGSEIPKRFMSGSVTLVR
jgi:gliding motility-associated-like protein